MNIGTSLGLMVVYIDQEPHFSQRTREMGHPALRDTSRMGNVGHQAEEAKFPGRVVEFRLAVRLYREGRATGPPEG